MNSAFHPTPTEGRREELHKAWLYVGRFLWGFGQVETVINELFRQLFGLRGPLYFLLLANLDLRKKVELMKVGFKHQGMDDSILSRVHGLANIRNVVAHGSFYYDPEYGGILFGDFATSKGESRLPHKPTPKPPEQDTEDNLVITLAEFDNFDREAAKLYKDLLGLDGSITPITDFPATLRSEIGKTPG